MKKFIPLIAPILALLLSKSALAFEVFRDENYNIYISGMQPKTSFRLGVLQPLRAKIFPNSKKCNLLVFNKSELYQKYRVTWNRGFSIYKNGFSLSSADVDTLNIPSANDFANPEPRNPCINGQVNLNLRWGEFNGFKIVDYAGEKEQRGKYYMIPPEPGQYEISGDESEYRYRNLTSNSCGLLRVKGTSKNLITKDTQIKIEADGNSQDFTVNSLPIKIEQLCRGGVLYIPY